MTVVEPSRDRFPAAVLWDMDGTLVDTEPYWIATERAMAEKYGATWTDADSMALVGSDLLDSGAYIKRVMGLELSPAEIVEELLKRGAAVNGTDDMGNTPLHYAAKRGVKDGDMIRTFNSLGGFIAMAPPLADGMSWRLSERGPPGKRDDRAGWVR